MTLHRALLALLVVTTACAAEEDVATWDEELSSTNGLTENSLTKNSLTKNSLTKNALTKNSLTKNGLTSPYVAPDGTSYGINDPLHPFYSIANDADSRTTLKYIYSCAMPSGTNMTISVPRYSGTKGYYTSYYTFYGQLGLAPEWATGSCGSTCQGWVSACVIARLNTLGTPVDISVRGRHTAVRTPSLSEVLGYPYREASFYGNIFVSPMRLYACDDSGLYSSAGYAPGRVCSDFDSADCPVEFTGLCPHSTITLPGGAVQEITNADCSDTVYTGYSYYQCKSDSGAAYSQVVTTFTYAPLYIDTTQTMTFNP